MKEMVQRILVVIAILLMISLVIGYMMTKTINMVLMPFFFAALVAYFIKEITKKKES